ncbi:acetyltransferase (GNAT) family protein [Desulfobotulus alkaliphilus]|uniref:Acetyltransferase (GNAT) family protein n=1 Tax=Desulfobotulus alkaliphilus TaxID=622671 RepID=A0A562S7H9_9BACT|nr:GNAT family N-acetyltransferase [Desulfobotulus alkaliphilus]TWI77347.1 acetyltransferase (GNAT) family protein [Desulfobotulus alkaliphilus]
MDRKYDTVLTERVSGQETDELLHLYLDFFYNREPLTKCIGFSRERLFSIAKTVYGGESSLSQAFCWIARIPAEGGRAAGFILCEDPAFAAGLQQKPENLTGDEAERILAVSALHEELLFPLHEMGGTGKGAGLHLTAVGVAPEYEGRGIAMRLMQTALAAACNAGFHYVFSECTGVGSRKLHEKCGFEQLKTIAVKDFLLNGEAPFEGCDVDICLMVKYFCKGLHQRP